MNAGIQKLQEFRHQAGFNIYMAGQIHKETDSLFFVNSQSWNDVYNVEIVEGHYYCTCKDYEQRSKYLECKHVEAIKFFIGKSLNQ